jgi:peptide/nickel transport system permease protein
MSRARRFLASPANLLALALIGLYVAVALAAPRLAPLSGPSGTGLSPARLPAPPSAEHPLGTVGGQSVYQALVWGTRDALRFGLLVTSLTALAGVTIGAIGGYSGGLTGTALMRVTDAFLAFPALAGAWLLGQIMFARLQHDPVLLRQVLIEWRLSPVMVSLILFSWMPYARLIHANVARLKRVPYVEAARALGASQGRIIVRHLLPNALAPVVVLAARDVGAMVIWATGFAFIGLGAGSTWGSLLVTARDFVIGSAGNPLTYWWTYLPVSAAIVVFGIGWNLLGDGLNQSLNPREG